ncbi:MAG: prephenate dehydrogenase, partial [Oscillospiraceae bacterium]|nr:prephenate dehydrogenase [Oscillospiraceae bacterium]
AKAYKAAGHKVIVHDTDEGIRDFAVMSEAADEQLTVDNGQLTVSEKWDAELIFLAIYPTAACRFLEQNAKFFPKESTVIDCCGTKKSICDTGFKLAEEYGFTFVGGHPMAGKEQSGFKHSDAVLFRGATMVIVPPESKVNDIVFLEKVKNMLKPAEFGRVTVSTAEKHDKIIAFTSQMAHLVSNAFIKSPTARTHDGFSAGSYKDLTRVAWLNERMWTELFMENRESLTCELDLFISALGEYRNALESHDSEALERLLRDGKVLKEEVDRR